MPYSGSQVDEQVVKMSFDNSNFDKNINDSIKILNNLDIKLGELNKNNFSSLTTNIDSLTRTFSVKGQIMLGVLTKLGNKIYDLGNRAFNKLTQGIRDGMGEYNTIIDSTEAIYQNVKQSGNRLQDVNNALDELNDYADKTIYNFGQMTRMIGMFSSAGVGLKSSVSTIKGLANSSALVGANMQKAQMAWNAVSRAMSSGKFTNVTWRSLELSGIAGKQFNKVITEVARTMKVKGKQTGKDIDGMIKKWGSLRESLREGWLTKDVFTQAMDIMSGALSDADLKRKGYTKKQIRELREIANAAEEAATRVKTFKQLMETVGEAIGSGWAQSFRILIGDLEEAKKLYTRISNVISDFIDNNAEIRNRLFTQIVNGKDRDINGQWKTGRDNFRQIIENMMAIVKTFLKSVKTGFINIFPIERISSAARRVLDIVQKFTRALVLNQEEINSKDGIVNWDTSNIDKISDAVKNLIRFFRGLAAAVDIAWMAISQPIKVIVKRIPFLNNFFTNTNSSLIGILNKLGAFGDKITIFQNAIKQTNFFGKALEILLDNIDELGKKYPVIGAVVWAFRSLKKVINDTKDNIKKLNIKPISTAFGIFKFIVTAIWRGLNAIFNLIQKASKKINLSWIDEPRKKISNVIKLFSDYGKGLIEFEDIANKVKDFFVKTFLNVKENTSNFFSGVSKKAESAKRVLTDSFNSAKESIKGFSEKVKNGASDLKQQFKNIEIAGGNAGDKVKAVWDKVKSFFGSISDFFDYLNKNSDNTVDGIIKKIALIAGAVAAAAITISSISKTFGKLRVLSNLSTLLKSGVDVIKTYQRELQTKTILNIAIAIGILAGALVAMSFVPYDKMENGLVMFASFMATIALTLVPLINSIALLNQAIANRKNVTNAQAFFKMFGDFGKKIAKGINQKAFGRACIYFAISIGIIIGAIVLLRKNFENLDDIEKPLNVIIQLMISMGVVIGGISIALTILSKSIRKTKAVVNIFSGFFQLAGVAHIIIAISLAIALLSQSIIALAKTDPDKTLGSVGLIGSLVALLGLVVIASSLIISQSKNFGKLKDLSLVLVAAASSLGIVILSFSALMSLIGDEKSDKWKISIGVFTAVIGQFTAMCAVLLGLSKKVGGRAEYWNQLNKFLVIITACMATLAAGLYLLSFSGKIDDSVVSVIKTLTIAASAIMVIIGWLTAISDVSFSTSFLKVIQGITYAVSAFAAAIGILAIGLTALVNAVDSIDVKSSESKNATNSFIEKIEYVAKVIKDSIPALKNLFYSVGKAAAEVFSSFTIGFLEKIIEIGDQYANIIDKIINLIIDIVGKIATVLYSRKEELLNIFNKVADLIVSLFTNALNQAFRRGSSETPIKESTVSKFLGIGAIFTTFTALASKLNTLHTFIKNNAKTTADVLNKINNKLIKSTSETNRITAGQYAAMSVAVVTALKATSLAAKGLRQLAGKESAYYRDDIKNDWDALVAFFTDSEYRAQTLIYSMALLGRVIINIFKTIGMTIAGPFYTLFRLIMKAVSIIPGTIADIAKGIGDLISNITGKATPAIDEFAKKFEKFSTDIYNFSPLGSWKDYKKSAYGGWSELLDFQIGTVKKAASEVGTESGTIMMNSFANAASAETPEVVQGISSSLWKSSRGEIDKFGKYINGMVSPLLNNAKKSVLNGTKEVTKGIADGAVKGINENKGRIAKALWKTGEEGKEVLNKVWDRHSPSKVTEALYKDVVMGGVVGIEKNKGKLSKAQQQMLNAQLEIAKDGTKALQAVYQALDIKYSTDRIVNPKIEITDNDDGTKKKVLLNEQYLDIIKEQSKEFEGKTRREAVYQLQQSAIAKGLVYDATQAKNVIDALLSRSSDSTKVTVESIQTVLEETTASVEDIVGKERAAQQLVITDTMNDYNELMNLANEHMDELVGKKKEEVQEYLYQEALKRGMSEETAKAMSKAATEELFKEKTKGEAITKEELVNRIDTYKKQYQIFCETEQAKTDFLTKMAKARAAIEESEYLKMQQKLKTGQITYSEYSAWAHTEAGSKAIKDYKEAISSYDKAEKAYIRTINEQRNDIVNKGLKTDDALKKAEEDAKKVLNESQSAQRGTYTSLLGQIKDLLGIKAPDLNLGPWKLPKTSSPNNLKDDKAVKAAEDTKKKLEANRADLTPTFDLDKLASDANKANGIVMSSLMAAQNASIGDYINKDSELNPFMKDRWQNVYNFTQNNYSPKALSRIDIYRQTQRQLSMSRGF